jgi:uncharacterized membrane protein
VVIGFRKVLFRSVKNFLLIGLWPAVGAIFMLYIFFAAIPNNEPVVNYLGLGLIVIGIVPMLLFYRRAKDAYFSRRPLEVPEDFDA